MLCLFLFRKWFCKELILKSMDDHGKKTYHNDYVTKLTLTRSVDQYPGIVIPLSPYAPTLYTQQVVVSCSAHMEVSHWESDPGENKEKQRVADLLTSIEHCLFDGANVMRILCGITHMPLWYSLKCVVAVNNMDGPPKLGMHICASKLFPHWFNSGHVSKWWLGARSVLREIMTKDGHHDWLLVRAMALHTLNYVKCFP